MQQRMLNYIDDWTDLSDAPDVPDSVATEPLMDLSHQPMVTVSAWAGV